MKLVWFSFLLTLPLSVSAETWSNAELKELCKAWRFYSEHANSVVGGMRERDFWNGIYTRSGLNATRTLPGCKCTWDNVRLQVSKMMNAFTRAEANPQSGETTEDLKRRAEALYISTRQASEVNRKTGKAKRIGPFAYWDCFEILKTMPRWNNGLLRPPTPSSTSPTDTLGTAAEAPEAAVTHDNDHDNNLCDTTVTGSSSSYTRPQGRRLDEVPDRPDGGKRQKYQERVLDDNKKLKEQQR
eukprot:GHVU01137371.1.p1 GENE.GHVU01137371.1~~GHVU01137371.1.p1  ORF type:complete len:242 (+),score=36.79 GHVU01137371.1:354-1079(+)